MRSYVLSRRWIPWHLFCASLVAGLIVLGGWQWMVAMAPAVPGGPASWHLRNLVYALQWWIFAGFGTWFWFRFMRDQRDAELAEARAEADQDECDAQPDPSAESVNLRATAPSDNDLTAI